jgi:hypothetical protein
MAVKKSTPKPTNKKPKLFYLEIPKEHPGYSPEPTLHYGLATGHLEDEINNLETVEQLAAIDQGNKTVQAMSFSLLAVIERLKDILEHFRETTARVKPYPDQEGGAA